MTEFQRDYKIRAVESAIDRLSTRRSNALDNVEFSWFGVRQASQAAGLGSKIGQLEAELAELKSTPVEPDPPVAYRSGCYDDYDGDDDVPPYDVGQMVEGKITTIVNQGFLVDVEGYEAFLPYSHADVRYVKNADKLLGVVCEFEVLECDDDNFKVSRKNVLLREIEKKRGQEEAKRQERQKKKADFFDHLIVGKVVEGTVEKLFDYGALVDIGGFCGMLPVNEISYREIQKPTDLIVEGQTVRVVILSVDKVECRAKLSMRRLEPQRPNSQSSARTFKSQSVRGDNPPWRIQDSEGAHCEFKASLIYSPKTRKPGTDQVECIAATVAAFMNSDGGILYLGVKDNGDVVGVEGDFDVLDAVPVKFQNGQDDHGYDYAKHRNIDGFKNKLGAILKAYLGAVEDSLCERETKSRGGKTCVAVHVPRSDEPVYFGPEQDIYVRADNHTRLLTTAKEVVDYIKCRFSKGRV